MSRTKTILISLVVLAAAVVLTALIFLTEPTAERGGAVRETAMLVDVTGVERGTFQPSVRAMGTVEPSQDVMLAPRVGGEIRAISDAFMPGGTVRRGDVLLRLDPSDYENVIAQRRSALSQAQADLNIELGRQTVALRDFELLGESLAPDDSSLVLRQPQLEAARSRVESARAALEQAELDLERTVIRAPFDAHILTRNVNVGSQVAAGEPIGRLVGLDTYWVVATVPQSQLRWLRFPDQGSTTPSEVRIRNRTAWNDDEYRTGTLYRLVGALESETRMARVIVDVEDPMAVEPNHADAPPLMIGSFVEALIEARPLEGVFRVDRNHVRENDTVWVMEDGVLAIRSVDIVFRDAVYAYIEAGLNDDDQIVTTNLATVVEGAPLRLAESTATPEQGALPQTSPADTTGN